MPQHTPLHAAHVAAGARMVDFAGWDMPVNYGSQIEEHHAVRRDAGMFDVSHMLALDLAGAGSDVGGVKGGVLGHRCLRLQFSQCRKTMGPPRPLIAAAPSVLCT